ncbi:MAG: glutamine synthetase family protein [Actinomycetota bacterium]
MTPEDLAAAIGAGDLDTVIMAFTDHYGRTVGKRFDAEFFLETISDGTHACNYLLTCDMEMEPVEGYAFANWSGGYGDVHVVPDLATLRRCGWDDSSAMVLCDLVDQDSHELVPVAPRTVLRRQVERAAALGLVAKAASELEFFLYRDSYREAHRKGYNDLERAGWYNEDYHLLQGGRVEDYVGAARRALRASGVPVENSKGEAAVGQHELNIRYAEILDMADRHVVMKHAMKEVADRQGVAVTFMAKPHEGESGNSCHIHLSLWRDEQNMFADDGRSSDVFRWFLGGWMKHAPDLMPLYAPNVNSYKRYQSQSWAPTRLAWSTDNRTAAFRVVGSGPSLRIEFRVPGGDVNPYLAFAAALASGLDGIENRTEPPEEHRGDVYSDTEVPTVPTSLRAALTRFRSGAAAALLGADIVEHYAKAAETECAAYEAAVTDWERRRYFERI